jgi:prolyl-tRNA synthetase
MFHIEFENENNEKKFAWQTSWGLTTRSIGIMTMYHGDDKGLVLPPRVAALQVVIVPILMKGEEGNVLKSSEEIFKTLKQGGIRVQLDEKTNYTPGWKFNYWELKGVPIRLEVGPKDVKANEVKCVIRFDNKKMQLKRDGLVETIKQLLDEIQNLMLSKARAKMM